jgi:predicted ArsR family transcriptional regulator
MSGRPVGNANDTTSVLRRTAVAAEPAARRRVLDVLAASRHPLDAEAVATELGVHVTTARFHLDQLEVAGLVQRRTVREKRAGRPRVAYALSASVRAADAREQLIEVLAQALGDPEAVDAVPSDDGHSDVVPNDDVRARAQRTHPAMRGSAAAVRAGERWADAMESQAGPAGALVDAVGELVDVLDSLGFDPEVSGEEILMHECPFRSAARERPDVVCAVHQGLVQRMLGRGAPAASVGPGARLVPFVEPELCVVRLGARA